MEDPVFNLSLPECNLVANIIDTCSQRGAFKPTEFQLVGEFFERIVGFIQENTPKPEEPEAIQVDLTESAE